MLENGGVQEDLKITSWVRLVVLCNINFTTGAADLHGCFIRSRPHPLFGDRPSYRMALECGVSFFIRTT